MNTQDTFTLRVIPWPVFVARECLGFLARSSSSIILECRCLAEGVAWGCKGPKRWMTPCRCPLSNKVELMIDWSHEQLSRGINKGGLMAAHWMVWTQITYCPQTALRREVVNFTCRYKQRDSINYSRYFVESENRWQYLGGDHFHIQNIVSDAAGRLLISLAKNI